MDARRRLLLAIALVALGLIAYVPLASAGWIWDDDSYVTENPVLVAPGGLADLWIPGRTPQYYPLVFTSFWIEARLYGDGFREMPLAFHLVNLTLHLASAFLLWSILRRLGVPGAWFAAALFAVHPMQAESVAWVTERKNTLSLVCALAAVRLWLAWRESDPPRIGMYLGALLLFVAGMLAKTTVAAVAPALVLIELWRHRRLGPPLVAQVLPFFAVGVPLGLLTAWVERTHVGAEGAEFALSAADRLVLAGRVSLFYVTSFVWPANLAFIYPRWTIDASSLAQWIPSLLGGVVLAAGIWAWRFRGWAGPLTLTLLFAACVFPAMGFIDVYPFRYSYVADHFAYLATIPLAIGTAWGLSTAVRHLPGTAQALAAGAILVVLASRTFEQVTWYRDEETLWRSSLARNPDAWMPLGNLAVIMNQRAGQRLDAGDRQRAEAMLAESEGLARRSTELAPEMFTSWINLAESLRLQGRLDEALAAAVIATERAPGVADTHWGVGRLHELRGDLPAAAEAYRRAVDAPEGKRSLRPGDPGIRGRRLDLGRVLQRIGRDEEAEALYAAQLAQAPGDGVAAGNLAAIRLRRGDSAGAIEAFVQAFDIAGAVGDTMFGLRFLPAALDAAERAPDAPGRAGLVARVLPLARQAVAATKEKDPLALSLLARAERAAGDDAAARAAIAKAVQAAADAPDTVRAEIERRAAEFAAPAATPAQSP